MGHARASASSCAAASAAALKSAPRSPSPEDTVAPSATSTDAAVKSILNSRKCWRSLKGKEEPVWPPHLEAALIEGLEKYRPSESKSTRTLGRFPMRNKFVADHIFDTTGVRRTPKQVGSRIQQLRDTQSGKQILKVISDRHYEMMHPHRAAPRTGGCALQSSSTSTPNTLSPSHIWVQTLPASASWRFGSDRGDLHSAQARPLRLVNPAVTFSSLSQTPCQSVFSVFRSGALVHQEVAPVVIAPQGGCWMYSTTLVPKFWAHLCEVEDPMAYTIHQEVMRVPHASHAPMLSVFYHFVHGGGAHTPPLSPRSSSGDSDGSSLSRSSSPQYDTKPFPAFSPSPLVYSYDASSPASPLDLRAVGVDGWGYAPPAASASSGLSEMLAAGACDPIFEPYINI